MLSSCRRCDDCGLDWPTDARFTTCPLCLGGTEWKSDRPPMTAVEAQQLAPVIVATLPPLPANVLALFDAQWEALEREAARRSADVFGLWTVVDMIQERHWSLPAEATGR